jgi:putative transposase
LRFEASIMSRPKRLTGHSYTGVSLYFLTFCVRQRRHVFRSEQTFSETLTQIRQAASDERFALLAYCFMPDHAHLLVEGVAEDSNLRRFVTVAKRRSGAVYARVANSPLWQEGYYERVLRPGENPRSIARYILASPLRAGLVNSLLEYPFMGSDVWSVREMVESI